MGRLIVTDAAFGNNGPGSLSKTWPVACAVHPIAVMPGFIQAKVEGSVVASTPSISSTDSIRFGVFGTEFQRVSPPPVVFPDGFAELLWTPQESRASPVPVTGSSFASGFFKQLTSSLVLEIELNLADGELLSLPTSFEATLGDPSLQVGAHGRRVGRRRAADEHAARRRARGQTATRAYAGSAGSVVGE